MREILFKAKTLRGEWVEGNLAILKRDVIFNSVKEGCYISNSIGMPFGYSVRPETICQFTGIIDAKGSKMFTDDVCLDTHGRHLKIVEHNFRLKFQWINRPDNAEWYFADFIDWLSYDNRSESYINACSVTVITNVHNNTI